MNEDKIIQKLIEHDKRFDEHDERFDLIDERFNKLENEVVVFKDEFKEFKQQVFSTQDEILTILRRLDQERIFTTAWVSRIEKEVEEHKKEIAKIKQTLKIS